MNWPFVILAVCVAAAFGVPLYIVVNRHTRPPPPQHLSDSAGSAQFAAQAREAEARGRR